jgi:ubiquinone/menaquinone biosynthesis C-methylase UbiE
MKNPLGLARFRASADKLFLEGSLSKKAYAMSAKERRWILSNMIRLCPRDAQILDVGCGGGFLLRSISEVMQTPRLFGIDIRCSLIQFAREHTKANFVLASAHKLPFKQRMFDIIVMFDLLHHVTNVKCVVPDMMKTLKSPGYLIIVEQGVPSRTTSVLSYIYTKVLATFTKQPWTVRFLTPKEIRLLFPHVKKMYVREYLSKIFLHFKFVRIFLVVEKTQD